MKYVRSRVLSEYCFWKLQPFSLQSRTCSHTPCAPVAQRLEQQTHNLLVRGSNPCGGTNQPASSLTLTASWFSTNASSKRRWRDWSAGVLACIEREARMSFAH